MVDRPKLPDKIQALADATLRSDAHTPVSLREAIADRAASLSAGGDTGGAEIPDIVQRYVDKVALHAYKTTDRDIEGLKEAGYSEDEIFEITLSAALGAGLARFERGLAALGKEP